MDGLQAASDSATQQIWIPQRPRKFRRQINEFRQRIFMDNLRQIFEFWYKFSILVINLSKSQNFKNWFLQNLPEGIFCARYPSPGCPRASPKTS